MPEKLAYRRASDEGRTLTETRVASLNVRSDTLVQSIVDHVQKVNKGRKDEK